MKRNIHSVGKNTRQTSRQEGATSRAASQTAGALWGIFLKFLKTFIIVGGISGFIVLLSVMSVILSYRNSAIPDLNALSLNYSSTVYVPDQNAPDTYKEYMSFYSTENRVWVDYSDIPQAMIDAMTAIEDKRFWEHHGVDWYTTLGSVYRLATGQSGGGSTITQQLIKNTTGENDVSIIRKVKEIFSALNLEKKYSKQEILQAYLNVVNFGAGCYGVQAAANLYFDKDIADCSIAECAAIAGITQNPSRYNPLIYPENNKERQQVVIQAMYDQEKITYEEYQQAMEESEHMVFVGDQDDEEDDTVSVSSVWNWYIETMFDDLTNDLVEKCGYSEDKASDLIYHGGLNIYCSMNTEMQEAVERVVTEYEPNDPEIDTGVYVMDYSGRCLAVVGSIDEKTVNLGWNNATDSAFQTGSTMKPISVYATAMSMNAINYSTLLKDQPLDDYFGPGSPGPNNWSGRFFENMTVAEALGISQNAPAAQLCNTISPQACYDFLTNKVGFSHLQYGEDNLYVSSMALGGTTGGVTVREMAAGFAIFGNGGYYYKPCTYDYVTDADGNVILDNRDNVPTQALTTQQATIMNKLLHEPIYGGTYSQVSGYSATGGSLSGLGMDIFGKTGTTDNDTNSWFVGGTPFAVAAVWTGYDTLEELQYTSDARGIWRSVMTYLNDNYDFSNSQYVLDSSVRAYTFCLKTGKLASDHCTATHTGWYSPDNLPGVCTMEDHGDEFNSSSEVSSEVSSETSSESGTTTSSEIQSSSDEPSSSEESSSESEVSSETSSTESSSSPDENNG